MTELDIRATVNGRTVSVRLPTRTVLADFLRGELGLTGTKVSCEMQVCGVCTVLVERLAGKRLQLPGLRHRRS